MELNLRMSSVIIVGGIPNPIGGVTSYIERLVNFLPQFYESVIDLYPNSVKAKIDPSVKIEYYSKNNLLKLYLRLIKKFNIYHFNFSSVKSLLFLYFLYKKSNVKWVLTLHHGNLYNFPKFVPNFIMNTIIKRVLAKCDKVIAISSEQRKFYSKFIQSNDKIIDQNTFVPYIFDNKKLKLPEKVLKFIEEGQNPSNSRVILMNGYCQPYYNFQHGIELVKKHKSLKIIIVLYGGLDNKDYYSFLKEEESNHENIIVCQGLEQKSFMSLLRLVDIYWRANSIDSFGITVADAVLLKKLVIATDVCERFKGAITYKLEHRSSVEEIILKNNCERSDFDSYPFKKELYNKYNKIYTFNE